MKFSAVLAAVAAPVLALASTIPTVEKRAFCPEAARFGVFSVTPTSFNSGDVSISICMRHTPLLIVIAELLDNRELHLRVRAV